MADISDQLVSIAADAITADRVVDGPYPPDALARSTVDALLAPENHDALLAALGARRVGYKLPSSRLLHDDPRSEPGPGAEPVYKIRDPRNFT